MDVYHTRYSDLTNEQVNELYRSEVWESLSLSERLDALQELENRSAVELGNKPCEVMLKPMEGAYYGAYHDGGRIFLNKNLVETGDLVVHDENGDVLASFHPDNTNVQLMDTIHHENFHAYQYEAINGIVNHENAAEVQQWKANWQAENYIRANDPEHCYRLQCLEKSAFNHGEAQTKRAFEAIETKYGIDTGYQSYLESIMENSFEYELEQAQAITGDQNIESSVNQKILDNYNASIEHDSSNNCVMQIYSLTSADSTNQAELLATSSMTDIVTNSTDDLEYCL